MVVMTLPSLSNNLNKNYWNIPYKQKVETPVYNFEREVIIDFEIPTKNEYTYFVVWNLLDAYSTHKVISSGNGVEINPVSNFILGTNTPNFEQVMLYKLGITYLYHETELLYDKKFVKWSNIVGTFVVINNFYVMSRY